MDRQICAVSSNVPLSGRKAKPKAPLPPLETKATDCSSFDDLELANYTMEQKENIIDRDIELSVVLPGEVIKTTNVNGSKPMMDLLVYLCAQYHLNPASHTIDLMSAEKKPIKFKPNTPIGMLEVDQVILKPKQIDKKKPIPIIPEQTVRVVVNYKKTQKTIIRVSPYAPLQEIVQLISNKCDFDPLHTILLKTYQSRETLDLTKSLNDLGLRELYAMDVSRGTSAAEYSLSSLQDSFQNVQNSENLKEKENKGFFGIFQRSKKKRQQTASAPATPLMNKPRPAFAVRSSSISKQYDSNTLPSEMPKKRRAPLPPMPASQSVPQDLAQTQDKPKICMLKSSSMDETDKGLSGVGIVRTGSLHLSGTSSVNSSLRRAKRKAPSPPPRKLQGQSDPSIDTGSESAESIHVEGIGRGRYSDVQSPTGNIVDLTRTTVAAGTSCSFDPTNHDQNNVQQVSEEADIGSEYSLEEIDEKEEMHDESLSAPLEASLEVPLDVQKHEPASHPSFGIGDNAQESNEDKTENTSAGDKAQGSEILREKVSIPNGIAPGTLQPNTNNGCSEPTFPLPSTKLSKVELSKSNKFETLDFEAYKHDTTLNGEHTLQESLSVHGQKHDQVNVDVVKTQDAAIQTTSEDNFGRTALSENSDHQGHRLSTYKNSTHVHKPVQENHPSGALNRMNKTTGQAAENSVKPNGAHDNALVNDNQVLPETVVGSPVSSPTKSYPLYRQDSKPKPKPSNEITRDYIPKVGMTTYKIVPPKFLETVKSWEFDTVESQGVALSPKNENSQEFGTQTETANISKRLNETEPDFKNEVTLHGVRKDLLAETYTIADHSPVSCSNAKGQKMEVEHSRPNQDHPIPPLILKPGNKSSPPAVQEKPKILSPPVRPSNFYFQIQRRTSDHYVTSAIARSGSLSSPTQNEAKAIETEKKLASPDQTCFPFPRTITVPSQLAEETTENGCNEEERKVTTSPVKASQPLNPPSSQSSPLNLKTLRTFVLPQPYSCPKPSPFALAVSSAVKRSQSFSKTCSSTTRPLKEQSSLDLSSSVSSTEIKGHSPVLSPTAQTQQSLTDKQKNNDASYEQNRQAPPLFNHPTTAHCERSIAAAVQRSDPEQIHQSLLAAIRSGEAAAKLRRVAPPSNTVAINGRSSLSSSVSIETRYSSH
ncbi:cordon-bleu protein-like 1 isoform X3 [Candoia aspera]|uniref:cordon-bleu protein-like 1 isoform X3 n=1 Tax=Candoia aspera TaxID=51853 RepID=UPI002FD82340